MTETNQKILDMVLKNASVNEICAHTGLSSKQLFHRLNMLKIKGFNFSRKYYSDGEICYKLDKGFVYDKEVSLITKPTENEIKMVFISDLHLCSENQRLDLLNQVYELCAKEGIHVIINGGDLIDGLLGPTKKMYNNYEKQIEYAIKNYPFDKNILNFICLGNHDYNSLQTTGQDLESAINNKRHDIVSLGYGQGVLNIKNDEIVLVHPDTPIKEKSSLKPGSKITFYGHGHIMKNKISNGITNIYLPTLSDIITPSKTKEFALPSILIGTFEFKNGFFNIGTFEQCVFLDKMYKVNESQYSLIGGKNINVEAIKYEEERTPYEEDKPKTYIQKIQEKSLGLSQIEKFNNRYKK